MYAFKNQQGTLSQSEGSLVAAECPGPWLDNRLPDFLLDWSESVFSTTYQRGFGGAAKKVEKQDRLLMFYQLMNLSEESLLLKSYRCMLARDFSS